MTPCDNLHGTSFLEVVGKVFTKIIQKRIQTVVEDVVVDARCGLRSGSGCTDMVFCARQLVEKTKAHNTMVFFFVDLQKAMTRSAMWIALQKYGISYVMINLVGALHDNMKVEISIVGESAWIQTSNGLRQGCMLASTLFFLYSNMVMQW